MFKKNKEDTELLWLIGLCSESTKNAGGHVDIFDARPYLNAQANKIKMGGFEDCGPTSAYQNCSITFGYIDNIHVVKESFDKMYDLAF